MPDNKKAAPGPDKTGPHACQSFCKERFYIVMVSIAPTMAKVQGVTGDNFSSVDELPIVSPTTETAEDHEDEQEMRQRLEEWRAIATNLTGGFTQMPDAVRKDAKIGSNAKLVYEHLLFYMRQKDWCWPSQQRMAEELHISRRTVIRACQALNERGYIEKCRRGLGRTNYYFANPLTFVCSTGITLSRLCLHPCQEDAVAPGPQVAELYGLTFYANDPLVASQKCQNGTSRSDKMTLAVAPKSHTKDTKNEPHTHLKKKVPNSNEPLEERARTIRNIEPLNQNEPSKTKPNETPVSLPPSIPKQPNQTERSAHQAAQAPADLPQQPGLEPVGNSEPKPQKRAIPAFLTETIENLSQELGDWQRSFEGNITRAAKNYFLCHDYLPGFAVTAQYSFLEWIDEAKARAYDMPVEKVTAKGPQGANYMPLFWTKFEGRFHYDEQQIRLLRSDELLYEDAAVEVWEQEHSSVTTDTTRSTLLQTQEPQLAPITPALASNDVISEAGVASTGPCEQDSQDQATPATTKATEEQRHIENDDPACGWTAQNADHFADLLRTHAGKDVYHYGVLPTRCPGRYGFVLFERKNPANEQEFLTTKSVLDAMR